MPQISEHVVGDAPWETVATTPSEVGLRRPRGRAGCWRCLWRLRHIRRSSTLWKPRGTTRGLPLGHTEDRFGVRLGVGEGETAAPVQHRIDLEFVCRHRPALGRWIDDLTAAEVLEGLGPVGAVGDHLSHRVTIVAVVDGVDAENGLTFVFAVTFPNEELGESGLVVGAFQGGPHSP